MKKSALRRPVLARTCAAEPSLPGGDSEWSRTVLYPALNAQWKHGSCRRAQANVVSPLMLLPATWACKGLTSGKDWACRR